MELVQHPMRRRRWISSSVGEEMVGIRRIDGWVCREEEEKAMNTNSVCFFDKYYILYPLGVAIESRRVASQRDRSGR